MVWLVPSSGTMKLPEDGSRRRKAVVVPNEVAERGEVMMKGPS